MLEFEGVANACPCSICVDWRERNGMGEFAEVTEPKDDVVFGEEDVWEEGVYQPKCPCGSACWRCHPEPSSITNEDVIWKDEHLWGTSQEIEDIQDAVAAHGYVKISRILEETTSGAFLKYVGTDAQKWATEYCGMHGGDESRMIGWFANAIEAGRSAGHSGIQNTVSREQWLEDVTRLFEIANDYAAGRVRINDVEWIEEIQGRMRNDG